MFSDISTGRLWYADYDEMREADDGKPQTLATITVASDLEDGCFRTGGSSRHDVPDPSCVLSPRWTRPAPSRHGSRVGGRPRYAQLASDANGELYILTKVYGMIRAIVGTAAQ